VGFRLWPHHPMTHAFNTDLHEYRINDRIVPSVTQVLGDLIPCWHAVDWYLQRGRAVHACAAMIARGEAFDCNPQIEGQVAAARRFFAEVDPCILAVEQQVFSERYQYAGTLDLAVLWTGGRAILDFKASLSPSVPYQCAAYALALRESLPDQPEAKYCVGVQLNADGTYKMSSKYDLRLYKQGWLALLTAYNIRRQCGVRETTQEETGNE